MEIAGHFVLFKKTELIGFPLSLCMSGISLTNRIVFGFDVSCSRDNAISRGREPLVPAQIITSNTVWNADTVINLTGDVQIAAGVTLTIQPGAVVRGNGHTIQAFGKLNAAGSATENVLLDNAQLAFGSSNYAKTGQLALDYVTMLGGSLTPPSGGANYGNYQLTNSRFEGVSGYAYIYYPYGNNLIAHNDFHNSSSLDIGVDFRSYDEAQSFVIRDNSFKSWMGYPYNDAQYRTDNSLIVDWASYGSASPQVTGNNFFDVGKTALAVEGGYSSAKLSAASNWFGTTDPQTIGNMIFDQTDDLNAPSVISNTSPLSGPSATAWNIVEASTPGITLDVTQGNTIYYGMPYEQWGDGQSNPPSTARLQSLRLADLPAWAVQADGSLNVQSPLGQDELVGFRTVDLADATLTLSAASGTSAKGTVTVSYKAGYWPASEPGFDKAYYLRMNPDVAAANVDPLAHYQAYGWHEGRNPNAYFDVRYYLAQNPDVAAAGIDPLLHYEQHGWLEGRDPSLLFSGSKYLASNPDVQAAHVDPLQHFIQYGQVEGRMAFLPGGSAPADVLVNAAYYDAQAGATLIPTGAAAQQQAASSYHASGWQKGLNPNAFFDNRYYLSHNPDVAAAHIDPLQHYEQYGWKEGRDPSTSFSSNKYLAAYADVKAAGLDPLLHYIAHGQAEGRTAFAA